MTDFNIDVNDDYFKLPEKEDPKIEKIKNNIRKEKDKLKAELYQKEANSNEFLQEHNKSVVDSRGHIFYKVMTILFFLFLIIITGLIVWAVLSGKFSDMISPVFNNEAKINNTVNNEYKNTFNNDDRDIYNIQLNATINAPNLNCT